MTATALLLLLVLQLHVGTGSGENLIPHWQFDGLPNTWFYSYGNSHELQAESVVWTDGRLVRAIKCVEKHYSGCYPCWGMSEFIRIKTSLAYEFSIYIKSSGRDVHNYFGFYTYDCNKNRITSQWYNPYFKDSRNDGFRWKRWNGYVLPSYIFDSDSNGKADRQSHNSNGVDWVWPSNACYVRVRFGSCNGNGVGLDRTWFVFPTMKEVTPQLNMLANQYTVVSSLRTFDIANPMEWSNHPEVAGTAFVNGRYTAVHRSVELGTGCYNWARSRTFLIDHRKKYDFSIWILAIGYDLRNYLGFYAYDQTHRHIASGTIANPYFKLSRNDPAKWVRWNGFVLPSTVTSSSSDVNKPPNVPSYFSTGEDWKWPSNAFYAEIRFGSCHGDGNNQGKSYFALPQVLQSDLQL